jgi:hypothetical protein
MAITLTELKSEFGTYIATAQKEILKRLTQKTESMKYMKTIASKDLEHRAAQAVIDNLVQGFQKGFTPKGTATFTPLTLVQRRHKIDMSFYPDDIFESWIGFLADETKSRKDWPITRFIIDELVIPKVEENRELLLIGKGVYAAPVVGVAQATGKSMDGFVTILENEFADPATKVNFFDGGEAGPMTKENIVEFVEEFVDWISELYQGIPMNVYLSPSWFRAYKRLFRETYGADNDFNGQTEVILDSNKKLIALPSMAGKDVIFCTPKENFIRLINSNEGASNIEVQADVRNLLIFGDWHESVGFGMAEAIFAYVPEAGSGSTSPSPSPSPSMSPSPSPSPSN